MLLPALQLVRQVSTARFVYRVVKSEMTSPAASVGAGAMVFGTASGAETVMVELDGTASPPRVAVMIVVPPLRQVIKPSGLTVATAGLLDVNVYQRHATSGRPADSRTARTAGSIGSGARCRQVRYCRDHPAKGLGVT